MVFVSLVKMPAVSLGWMPPYMVILWPAFPGEVQNAGFFFCKKGNKEK